LNQHLELPYLIAKYMTDLALIIDGMGMIRYVSPSHNKVLGYDCDSMVGTSIFDYIQPHDIEHVRNECLNTNRICTDQQVHFYFLHADGYPVSVECKSTPITDGMEVPECFLWVSRKQPSESGIEWELRESEGRYKRLIALSPKPMATHRNMKFVSVNPAGLELFGAKDETDLIGKSIFDLVHPDFLEKSRDRLRIVSEMKYAESMEYKIIRLDGEIIEVAVIGIYEDKTDSILIIFNDVTKRKQMEKDLEKSEERFRRIVELSPMAIISFQGGSFNYINPSGLLMVGASRHEDVIGSHPLDWIHLDDREQVKGRIEATLMNGYSPLGEYRINRLDGKVIDVAASSLYDCQTESVLIVLQDITARKQAEEERGISEQIILASENRYFRLQTSLDSFSRDLIGVMKTTEMERLFINEVKRILKTEDVCLMEVDRENQMVVKSGNPDIPDLLAEAIMQKIHTAPICENVEIRNGCFMKIGEFKGKSYLLCFNKRPQLLNITSKRVWLKTIARYVSVLYDNFRLIEDLTMELEQITTNKVAPPWLVRLLFNLSENERKRLSQDLHDSALQEQIIWYRKLQQLSMDRLVPQNIQDQLQLITQGLMDVIYQIRITCNELRPPMLKEAGLVSSLEALFKFTQLRSDYLIHFESSKFRHHINDELSIGIYRIIQELLANATKHSNARRVHFILSSHFNSIRMSYDDDGMGIDDNIIQDTFTHTGVYGIKERVRSMDGKIEFRSSPNNGLSVFITIPAPMGVMEDTNTDEVTHHDPSASS
jgi:two-component system sensor histidine kinase ComP